MFHKRHTKYVILLWLTDHILSIIIIMIISNNNHHLKYLNFLWKFSLEKLSQDMLCKLAPASNRKITRCQSKCRFSLLLMNLQKKSRLWKYLECSESIANVRTCVCSCVCVCGVCLFIFSFFVFVCVCVRLFAGGGRAHTERCRGLFRLCQLAVM